GNQAVDGARPAAVAPAVTAGTFDAASIAEAADGGCADVGLPVALDGDDGGGFLRQPFVDQVADTPQVAEAFLTDIEHEEEGLLRCRAAELAGEAQQCPDAEGVVADAAAGDDVAGAYEAQLLLDGEDRIEVGDGPDCTVE